MKWTKCCSRSLMCHLLQAATKMNWQLVASADLSSKLISRVRAIQLFLFNILEQNKYDLETSAVFRKTQRFILWSIRKSGKYGRKIKFFMVAGLKYKNKTLQGILQLQWVPKNIFDDFFNDYIRFIIKLKVKGFNKNLLTSLLIFWCVYNFRFEFGFYVSVLQPKIQWYILRQVLQSWCWLTPPRRTRRQGRPLCWSYSQSEHRILSNITHSSIKPE